MKVYFAKCLAMAVSVYLAKWLWNDSLCEKCRAEFYEQCPELPTEVKESLFVEFSKEYINDDLIPHAMAFVKSRQPHIRQHPIWREA